MLNSVLNTITLKSFVKREITVTRLLLKLNTTLKSVQKTNIVVYDASLNNFFTNKQKTY